MKCNFLLSMRLYWMRRAEECYRGCLKEYQGLKRLFGRDGLDQLSKLYQDY